MSIAKSKIVTRLPTDKLPPNNRYEQLCLRRILRYSYQHVAGIFKPIFVNVKVPQLGVDCPALGLASIVYEVAAIFCIPSSKNNF